MRFVERAQELGLGLRQAETLLGLAAGGPESCDAARELAEEKMAELGRRIADLRAMRDSLQRLTATCAHPRADRECALLQTIERPRHERPVHVGQIGQDGHHARGGLTT